MKQNLQSPAWLGHSWGKNAHPHGRYPVAFRHDVHLDRVPAKAVVRVTASPHYVLWVNGVFVTDGPARCYPQRQLCDELDLAPYLRTGNNAVAMLVTDAAWKVRFADWYTRTSWLYTLPLGPQEHFDGTKEPRGWKTEPAGEGWADAFVLGGAGTPPWKSLVTSELPQSVRRRVQPELIWSGTTSRERCDLRLVNPAAALGALEFIAGEASAANVWVYDFGQTCSVSLGLDVLELTGAVRLEFHADIAWSGSPAASLGFGNPEEGCCDTVELGGKGFCWRGAVPRGMRFLTVRLVGEGTATLGYQHDVVEYRYPDKPTPFAADSFFAKVWEVSKTTLVCSTTDQIGEPARENVLWTLDACVAGKAAWYTFGEAALWRHCLLLIADGIDADGTPHAVVPASDSFMILFDQTLLWVVSCREYVELTGDRSLAALVAPAIARFLDQCRRHVTADGLFVPPGYAWHWVDWAKLDKRPYSFPVNGLLLWAAQAALVLGTVSGTQQTSATKLARTLRTSLLRFWDPQAQAFRSRLACEIDEPWNSINTMHPEETTYPVEFDLHSNALAWWTGLGTKAQRRGGVRKILALFEASRKNELGYGPLLGNGWTQLLLGPVFREGFSDEGLAILHELYQPWLDLGCVTWGEHFRPSLYNTAHGWGACVNSLLAEEVLHARSR